MTNEIREIISAFLVAEIEFRKIYLELTQRVKQWEI